jgi:hypothetical protein
MKAYGLLAAVFCIPTSYASDAPPVLVTHFEPLTSLTLESTPPGARQKVQPAAPLTLKFDTLGERYQLDLEPNDRLLSRASLQELSDDIVLYRGHAAGKAGSWTRIVIANGMPRGLIWDGEQMLVIEAPGDSAAQSATPIAYRLADAFVAPGTMTCGASMPGGSGAAMYTKLVAELAAAKAAAPGATMEIRLSAIGDFEFADDIGADVDAAIVTRLNNVDGIFSEQLGVQITVDTLEVHSDADDPFTDTADSGDLLDELGIYRRDTPPHSTHGLTHLYTGRNLDGTTVGIAYLDALCHPRFGAGLTEGRHGASFDSLIAAHEIGHNFGAPHDAEEGSACVAESEDFLMAPSVNGSDQFSQCSIAQMQPRIAAAACIEPLPSVDMTIGLDGSAPDILLGNAVSLTFDVTNVGTETATNVAANITVPNTMTLASVAASSGSCTSGAGAVACQLGTVAGGSNRTVTLQMTATASGPGEFVATVSADADDQPGNNEETVQATVTPAVDLVVNPLASAEVNLNQSTLVVADLENRATLDATGVEVSISFSPGLEAQAAEWALGTCTVSAQQVDCETGNFSSGSAAALQVRLAGTTTELRSYTVTISSAEADTDSSNNSAIGLVTVNAAAPTVSGGGGGGGATGVQLLWLLSAIGLLARCSRKPVTCRGRRRY